MMRYSAYMILIGILSLGLVGCTSSTVDQNTASRLVAGPLSVTQPIPRAELVIRVIESCRAHHPSVPIDLEVHVRDRRVGPKPSTQRYAEKDVPSTLDWGETTLQCRRIPLDDALAVLLDGVELDFHISPWSRKGRLLIVIGPPELVRDHPSITRRTYQVPARHNDAFAGLPLLLSSTGKTLAYDPQRRVLTVIDNEYESVVDRMLTTIGAERIDQKSSGPEF